MDHHKFTITLGKNPLKTPNMNIVAVPSLELAQLIAHEFNT
jgi:chaperone required for assembly of F1-ATPase